MTDRGVQDVAPEVEEAAVEDAAVIRPGGGFVDSQPGNRGRSIVRFTLIQIGVAVGVSVIWEVLSDLGAIPVLYVSRPTAILEALWTGLAGGTMLPALGVSLGETVIGFVIASVLGIVAGVVLYEVPSLERIVRPFLTALNNLPRLALTPLFVVWLGVGFVSHIALIVTMVFFVVLLNTFAGFQGTDRDYLLLAKVLGTSRWKLFTTFMFPAATPAIFVGLQLGLTYSFMGAVIGEIITGGIGLGALVSTYSASYNSAAVFALLLLMALVATALSSAMRVLETSLLRWRVLERRGLTKS